MFITANQPSLRTMVSAFAASALITALTVVGSASPASAATPYAAKIERQLNGSTASARPGVATIVARVDADGRLLSTSVVRSAGHVVLDRDAIETVRAISFPVGDRARNVAIVLTFNGAEAPATAETAALVSKYVNAKGEALAATPAPNAG